MTSYEPKHNRTRESISSFIADRDVEKEQERGSYKSEDLATSEPVPGEPPLASTFSRDPAVSIRSLEPAPDGGLKAWTQVAMAHLTIFSTWGWVTSYGVFQEYYRTSLGLDPSAISWIGSVQIFLLFFLGTFSGRALDAGLFRHVYFAGTVFQLLGVFSMSAATNYWQLFLSQGLCIGIAGGLQFCPAMSLISTYFVKKRSFAIGLVTIGSCTGGVVFPIVVQQLLPRIGFPWTIRVCGFLMLFTNILTNLVYRTRLPPRKAGPIVEWSSFRELPYVLYCAGMFFNFWGLYFAFFYVGSYGRNIIGMSYHDSVDLLLTMVAVGFLWRLLPNYFADRMGAVNVMLPFTLLCAIMMYAWIGVHSKASLFVFAAIYGSGSAGLQSMFPAGLSSLTTDMKKTGVRMGMGFTIVSFACLTGPPLAGALISNNDGNYLPAQIWGGTSFLLGASLLTAARTAKVGLHLKQKV
ncbi:MFS monocarboxylate transporter-like protein [Aureobasidium pullulans]|nr:MFS monocarboxylate transporter-like protein [Aureobasidium pullulans]